MPSEKRMSRLCIVFDLDDTLYLERDYVLSGFRAVGKWVESNLNLANFAGRASELFAGGAGSATFQETLNVLGCQPEPHLLSAMVDVYRTHTPEISLPPDSTHCLAVMGDVARLGLITDGRPLAQHAKCERLGLPDLLSTIVCTGSWGAAFHKPHKRAFEFMERQLGSRDDTFVYVADNPLKDFTAPLARGWTTVRIRRPGGLYAHLESSTDCAPHKQLEDLWHLPRLIEALAPGCLSA
jgi:putative hydrolase of the HAD superfamily